MLDLNVWRTLEHKYGHREDTQCPQSRPGWAPDGSLTLKLLNGSRGPDKSHPVSRGCRSSGDAHSSARAGTWGANETPEDLCFLSCFPVGAQSSSNCEQMQLFLEALSFSHTCHRNKCLRNSQITVDALCLTKKTNDSIENLESNAFSHGGNYHNSFNFES